MPSYQFRSEDTGELVEVFLSFDEHDRRVKNDVITLDDGRTAKKVWDWGGSQRHRAIATCPGNWPQVSYAAGVHPDQIPEQQAALKAAGVRTTYYTKEGDPIFEDRHHRREALIAMGLYDRNAGYSDPTPKHVSRCRKYR